MLLEQRNPLRRHKATSLHADQVRTRGEASRIKLHRVSTGRHRLSRHQYRYLSAKQVRRCDANLLCLWESKGEGGSRIKRVRVGCRQGISRRKISRIRISA